jgi:hypothetical protein
MRRVLLFMALATPACVHAPPAASPAGEAPEPVTVKAWRGVPLPDICLQQPAPLDDAGREALATLERHVVHDVLFAPDPEPERYWKKHDDGHMNATEVGHLMHKYSVNDLLFAFPVPVDVPRTHYQVRTTGRIEDLEHVDHPVFYVGIEKVSMVRLGTKMALLFKWSAGPSGKPPKDVIWMWGTWGRLCAVPNPDGTWHAVPVGSLATS